MGSNFPTNEAPFRPQHGGAVAHRDLLPQRRLPVPQPRQPQLPQKMHADCQRRPLRRRLRLLPPRSGEPSPGDVPGRARRGFVGERTNERPQRRAVAERLWRCF